MYVDWREAKWMLGFEFGWCCWRWRGVDGVEWCLGGDVLHVGRMKNSLGTRMTTMYFFGQWDAICEMEKTGGKPNLYGKVSFRR